VAEPCEAEANGCTSNFDATRSDCAVEMMVTSPLAFFRITQKSFAFKRSITFINCEATVVIFSLGLIQSQDNKFEDYLNIEISIHEFINS
jgi:hypothetical protein